MGALYELKPGDIRRILQRQQRPTLWRRLGNWLAQINLEGLMILIAVLVLTYAGLLLTIICSVAPWQR